MPKKMRFGAEIIHFSDKPSSHKQLTASEGFPDNDEPRFFIEMRLAVLNKKNGNKHRIKLAQAQKAIEALGEIKNIPGNINHDGINRGSAYDIWIEQAESQYPILKLGAVYWMRSITDEEKKKIKASYDDRKLGASWEIDSPYELKEGEDDPEAIDIEDFQFSGFGLTVGLEPAEDSTKGTAQITAAQQETLYGGIWVGDQPRMQTTTSVTTNANDQSDTYATVVVETSPYDGTDFITRLPCPICNARYGQLVKADYENAVFVVECGNDRWQGGQTHRFEVSINIKAEGEEATYRVVQNDSGLALKNTGKEALKVPEYTDEQIEQMKREARNAAIQEYEEDKERIAKAEKDKQDAVEQAVADATPDIEKKAVDEYKTKMRLAASRVDMIHEILPFESEEAKISALGKYGSMTDVEFEHEKALKTLQKQRDDALAEVEKLKAGEDPEPDSSIEAVLRLPSGRVEPKGKQEDVVEEYEAMISDMRKYM